MRDGRIGAAASANKNEACRQREIMNELRMGRKDREAGGAWARTAVHGRNKGSSGRPCGGRRDRLRHLPATATATINKALHSNNRIQRQTHIRAPTSANICYWDLCIAVNAFLKKPLYTRVLCTNIKVFGFCTVSLVPTPTVQET